jgi:hypothetical protein
VRVARTLLVAVLGGVLATATARAQDSAGLAGAVANGVRHYSQLDYDSAAITLRRALAVAGDSMSEPVRIRAMTYLGAAELFRGRRDSAFAAFRRLVMLDPRAHPDPLVFPPEVTTIYDFAREATKVVTAVVRDTSIRLGADRFRAQLFASSFHQIIATLEREDGFTVRTLYAGPISDTLQVFWTGEDTVFLQNDSGRLVFSVTSLTNVGRQSRVLRVPMDLVLGPQDTLPTPTPIPDSLFLPERESAAPGFRAMVRGAGVGLLVGMLPALVAGGNTPSGSRYAVAGGLTLAGVVGFLKHRPGKALPDNIAANEELRGGLQAQIDMTAQENAIRVLQKRLDIHPGPTEIIGGRP